MKSETLVINSADVEIENGKIKVFLKKKRNLPLFLEAMRKFDADKYEWMNNLTMEFHGAPYS